MKTVSIIRERGQLTIPDSIRKSVPWVNPLSVVTISLSKPDEIVIKPHQNDLDWDSLWDGLKKARSIKGTQKSLSTVEFLEKDRNSH